MGPSVSSSGFFAGVSALVGCRSRFGFRLRFSFSLCFGLGLGFLGSDSDGAVFEVDHRHITGHQPSAEHLIRQAVFDLILNQSP